MTTVDWKNKAIEKAKIATELDNAATAMKEDVEGQRDKYSATLDAYRSCLEAFSYALKWEKNKEVKNQYNKFALEYMERAEKMYGIVLALDC